MNDEFEFGKTIPHDILLRIKDTYGQGKLRQYAKFYGSNLPEYTWDEDYDGIYDTSALWQCMKNKENVSVFISSNKEQNKFISSGLKTAIKMGMDCYRIDFFHLMTSSVDSFNRFLLDKIMREFLTVEVLAITGIRFGDLYDKYAEHFSIIYDNLLNDNLSKGIVLGMENVSDKKKAYGELYDALDHQAVFVDNAGYKE